MTPTIHTRMLRLAAWAFAGLLSLTASQRPGAADGLTCAQDCSTGTCAQAMCGQAGSASGYCNCSGGAMAWSDTTSSAWCAASGQPLTACVLPTPLTDANGNPVSQPPAQLTNPDAMAAALAASNPYVATLVAALESGTQWVQSPVQGLIHDSSYDPTLTQVTFTAALPFAAQVTTDNLGGAQLSITVTGDITQLVNLRQYASSTTPAAVPPQFVQGSVTSGGLHGSLQVTAAGGAIQAIQW